MSVTSILFDAATDGTKRFLDLYEIPASTEPAFVRCRVKMWNISKRQFAVWELTFFVNGNGEDSAGQSSTSFIYTTDYEAFHLSDVEGVIMDGVCRLKIQPAAPAGCDVKVEVNVF